MNKRPFLFGICGPGDSGKTLLIERLLPRLRQKGLKVAVIKSCPGHRLEMDRPGKDTARLYDAGADVLALGAGESFARFHGAEMDLNEAAIRLGPGYDIALVEGGKEAAIPKLWLCREGERAERPDCENVVGVLGWKAERDAEAERLILEALERDHRALPLCAVVLIGGRSSRLGRPKSMLEMNGRFVLEGIVGAVRGVVDEVVLAGSGEIPARLSGMGMLPDVVGVEGPMAGMLAAFRRRPEARWLVLACDLPLMSSEAAAWLVGHSAVGVDAVMPYLDRPDEGEPLFALYEPSAAVILERAARGGERSMQRALKGNRVVRPRVPVSLRESWRNVNTLQEWATVERQGGEGSRATNG